jgi:hypothetical protein
MTHTLKLVEIRGRGSSEHVPVEHGEEEFPVQRERIFDSDLRRNLGRVVLRRGSIPNNRLVRRVERLVPGVSTDDPKKVPKLLRDMDNAWVVEHKIRMERLLVA